MLCLCIARLAYGDITWNTPILLSDPTSQTDGPVVGLDASGNAVDVWQDSNSDLIIKGSTKLFLQPWTPATGQNIDSSAMPQAALPVLSVDSQGNALALWNSNNGSNTLRYSYKPFGMAWSPNQVTGFQTSDYLVVLNPPGNGTAVWIQGTSLFASTFNGTTWIGTVPIDVNANAPSLAVDPNGNATAVWIDTSTVQIKSANLPFGGVWSAPIVVETFSPGFLGLTSVGVDASGNAVALWSSDSGIQSATKLFNQSWSAVTTFPSSGTSASTSTVVAVDPQGNAVALWQNDTNGTIMSASKPFGQPWSNAVTLGSGSFPQIAVDSCGTAVGVWENPGIIQTAFKALGADWIISKSFTASNAGGDPWVSMNPCGHVMVTWVGTDGPNNTFAVEGFIAAANFSSLTGKQKTNNSGTFKEIINVLNGIRAPRRSSGIISTAMAILSPLSAPSIIPIPTAIKLKAKCHLSSDFR